MTLKKLFLSFLLVLLPLQFAQAAMCAYCEFDLDIAPQHEAASQHEVSSASSIQATVSSQHSHDQQGNGLHNGCGVCHLCCAKLLGSNPGFNAISGNAGIPSHFILHPYPLVASGIERPNWLLAV